MKKTFFAILAVFVIFTSCGEDSSPSEEVEITPEVTKDSIPTIEGEIIFLADAAVLKGKNFIYGVEIDSVSRKLADSISPMKKDEFHMIPVIVKGKIIENPGQEGWEEMVQIREIIEITSEQKRDTAPQVTKDLDKP